MLPGRSLGTGAPRWGFCSFISHAITMREARRAIYEQARTALHKRLGNDPHISDSELTNERHRLEVAIYEVEEDLLLKDMRR